MSQATENENEKEIEFELAQAAATLCELESTPESRFKLSLITILATAIVASVATCLILLFTWQFSIALLGTIWLWAAGLTAIFYWGELPRLLGFGAVTGAFEIGRHSFIEGTFTKFVKTLRFRPKLDN